MADPGPLSLDESFALTPTTPTTPFRSTLYNHLDIDDIATWRYGHITSSPYAGIVFWGGRLGGGENRASIGRKSARTDKQGVEKPPRQPTIHLPGVVGPERRRITCKYPGVLFLTRQTRRDLCDVFGRASPSSYPCCTTL